MTDTSNTTLPVPEPVRRMSPTFLIIALVTGSVALLLMLLAGVQAYVLRKNIKSGKLSPGSHSKVPNLSEVESVYQAWPPANEYQNIKKERGESKAPKAFEPIHQKGPDAISKGSSVGHHGSKRRSILRSSLMELPIESQLSDDQSYMYVCHPIEDPDIYSTPEQNSQQSAAHELAKVSYYVVKVTDPQENYDMFTPTGNPTASESTNAQADKVPQLFADDQPEFSDYCDSDFSQFCVNTTNSKNLGFNNDPGKASSSGSTFNSLRVDYNKGKYDVTEYPRLYSRLESFLPSETENVWDMPAADSHSNVSVTTHELLSDITRRLEAVIASKTEPTNPVDITRESKSDDISDVQAQEITPPISP